jgi:hypothetical protein
MAVGRDSLDGLHWPTHAQTMANSRRVAVGGDRASVVADGYETAL